MIVEKNIMKIMYYIYEFAKNIHYMLTSCEPGQVAFSNYVIHNVTWIKYKLKMLRLYFFTRKKESKKNARK